MRTMQPLSSPPHNNVLTPRQATLFREAIQTWFKANRRNLPWRVTGEPYAILVSEIMLQQTQVDRVIGKYAAFMALFPDFTALARAPLQEVLAAWQGLGYNRRAVALKKCAEAVMSDHGGFLPKPVEALETLPGIGPYTARAVAAFAFGQPTVFIETNIRTVFIHHFFADRQGVKDSEILPLVTATLDRADPRDWYNALFDYGVMLKKTHKNPSRRSAHHVSQTPFRGSNRELRSHILKALLAAPRLGEEEIIALVHAEAEKVSLNLAQMEKEGFIRKHRGRFMIR